MIEPGTIVRVVQLGRAGWTFKHPAFARLRWEERDGQRTLDFMLVDGRDVDAMLQSGRYGLDFATNGYSTPEENLVVATEDEAAIATAAVVLTGRDLVITREPVSLAN